jgi:hypothetical protein
MLDIVYPIKHVRPPHRAAAMAVGRAAPPAARQSRISFARDRSAKTLFPETGKTGVKFMI